MAPDRLQVFWNLGHRRRLFDPGLLLGLARKSGVRPDHVRNANDLNRLGRSIVARSNASITENLRQDKKANELEAGSGKRDVVQRTPPARLIRHSLIIKCTNFTNASIKPHRVKHRCDENGKINDEFSPSLRDRSGALRTGVLTIIGKGSNVQEIILSVPKGADHQCLS